MIDVLELGWGRRPFKFAKQAFVRPVINMSALAAGDPKLERWVQARLRPKLLMATQTRVAEIVVDEFGELIPATPVLSIEPVADDNEQLWMLAAALSSPVLSARFVAANFGTAMAITALKVAARDVLEAPLPVNEKPWREAAEMLRTEPVDLAEYAALMGAAYGVTEQGLIEWWRDRVPNRSKSAG